MHPSYTPLRRRARLVWMVRLVAVYAVAEVVVEAWGFFRKRGLVELGDPRDRARNAGW